ncbi:MAG: cytochrome c maturation protein CcmE [Proteobacteria bacterium]|nr:cytochrome c maturation protein CcmE [Pseudomonadota bacterium]
MFLISLISIFFIITNFKNNIVFFFSPSEISQIKNSKKIIRVGGMIKENSVKKIDALNTIFIITDYQNDLIINYRGILPDLFRDKQGVVAKGKFDLRENKFYSEELLVKHDENYMPPEVARDLQMKMPTSDN